MALTAALLGWLFDGLEMGLFPLVQKPALDELVGRRARSHPLDRHHHQLLSRRGRDRRRAVRLARRSHRPRALHDAKRSYLCPGQRPVRLRDQAWQIGRLAFHRRARHGGRMVARRRPHQRNLARPLARLPGGPDRRGGQRRLSAHRAGRHAASCSRHRQEVAHVLLAVGLSESWVDHLSRNQGWRFLMMLGAVPALLTFLIRWFVPESEKWERERGKGATSHWATRDLISVLLGAAAACGIICLWAGEIRRLGIVSIARARSSASPWSPGATPIPVLRYLQRASRKRRRPAADWRPMLKRMLLAATLSGVALLGTWGTDPAGADLVRRSGSATTQKHERSKNRHRKRQPRQPRIHADRHCAGRHSRHHRRGVAWRLARAAHHLFLPVHCLVRHHPAVLSDLHRLRCAAS